MANECTYHHIFFPTTSTLSELPKSADSAAQIQPRLSGAYSATLTALHCQIWVKQHHVLLLTSRFCIEEESCSMSMMRGSSSGVYSRMAVPLTWASSPRQARTLTVTPGLVSGSFSLGISTCNTHKHSPTLSILSAEASTKTGGVRLYWPVIQHLWCTHTVPQYWHCQQKQAKRLVLSDSTGLWFSTCNLYVWLRAHIILIMLHIVS